MLNWKMLLSIAIGIFVAWLGGRGVNLMSAQPMIVTGLLIGTILGVAFLGGVPRWPIDCCGYLLAIFRPRKIISLHL